MERTRTKGARRKTLGMIVLIVSLALAATANAQLRKLNIAYTATSPYQAVLIVAAVASQIFFAMIIFAILSVANQN